VGERQDHLSELEAASSRATDLDRTLAGELRHAPPAGVAAGAYLRELAARPQLTPERERELILAARAGDARARGALVEAFTPVIAATAATYRSSATVERLELLQEGVVGLLRALERYDPDRGVPFWGYAVWWVRQAMQQLVAELTRPVVLSDRALRQLARLRDAHRELVTESGREPSADALASRSGLDHDQVADLLAVDRAPRSLEAPVYEGESSTGTFGDLIADPLAEAAYEDALLELQARDLRALLSGLSRREREVLRDRFGLEGRDEASLRDIAGRLGLSAERVRQIESRALGKLRAAAGAD
jgi:RNA polymerase sigma factor (sigma-70 family)